MNALEEPTQLPFWQNRKFMVPILTTIATLAVAIAAQSVDLPFTDQQLGELLAAIWFFVVGIIAGGDVAYDLLGQILRILMEIVSANQPPAQPTEAQYIRPSEMVAPEPVVAYRPNVPNTSTIYEPTYTEGRDNG